MARGRPATPPGEPKNDPFAAQPPSWAGGDSDTKPNAHTGPRARPGPRADARPESRAHARRHRTGTPRGAAISRLTARNAPPPDPRRAAAPRKRNPRAGPISRPARRVPTRGHAPPRSPDVRAAGAGQAPRPGRRGTPPGGEGTPRPSRFGVRPDAPYGAPAGAMRTPPAYGSVRAAHARATRPMRACAPPTRAVHPYAPYRRTPARARAGAGGGVAGGQGTWVRGARSHRASLARSAGQPVRGRHRSPCPGPIPLPHTSAPSTRPGMSRTARAGASSMSAASSR